MGISTHSGGVSTIVRAPSGGHTVQGGLRHAASAAAFVFALNPIRWQIANTRSARFIV